MNSITNIQPPIGPAAVEPTAGIIKGAAAPEPMGIADTVEISAVARLAAKVKELPEVRTELVQRVRTELAAGTYETNQRIDIAVNRLMEELFPYG